MSTISNEGSRAQHHSLQQSKFTLVGTLLNILILSNDLDIVKGPLVGWGPRAPFTRPQRRLARRIFSLTGDRKDLND
jgi:hypothetical protein